LEQQVRNNDDYRMDVKVAKNQPERVLSNAKSN
jgi:hypothetical protein